MVKRMLKAMKRRVSEVVGAMGLHPVVKQVRKARLTYLSNPKMHQIQRELLALERKQIKGAMVEFGLALGGSGIVEARLAPKREFHGFDVFAMIPPPTSDKDDAKSKERYKAIKAGKSEGLGGDEYYGYMKNLLGKVKDSFAEFGVPIDGELRQLHKGLFEKTWPKVGKSIKKIAFAHIDCDWYDPVKYCLEAVADKMVSGGVIVLDDYNDYGGCRTATDEFLKARKDFVVVKNSGNLVLRKR